MDIVKLELFLHNIVAPFMAEINLEYLIGSLHLIA